MLTTYITRIRTVIEYAVQVYGCVLSGIQAFELEQLQSHAVLIILGSQSQSYSKNLETLGLKTLGERRKEIMLKFAISCYCSTTHRWWFKATPPPTRPTRTSTSRPRFIVPMEKSARHGKAPFSVYARLLNGLSDAEWEARQLPPPSQCIYKSNLQLQLKPDNVLTDMYEQTRNNSMSGPRLAHVPPVHNVPDQVDTVAQPQHS